MRVKFSKEKQRKFLKDVMNKVNCLTLREFSGRLQISYSTMKNYFVEDRTLPKNLFQDLCKLSGFSEKSLRVLYLEDNWGKVKGGRK